MQTMKILLLLALTCGFCLAVEFEPCPHALIGESCNMTCHVPDFSKTILILCNGVTRGSCSTFLGCGSNVIQEGGNKAHLKISSLSYTSDSCEWSCTYGTNSSSPLNVTIYSGISNLNLTSEINADGVKLTAIADCLYPYDPIVDVQYSIELDGQYASLSQQVDLQSSTTPGGCSDAIERRVTATYDVSAKHAELKGKSVFFRMKFSQYPSGEFNFTNTKGSFFFEGCKYSDVELIFGGVSCFLIVLITSIIMLIIQGCKILLEIFGDIKPNKLIIIIVFDLVALIIGLALGFSLKECDQRDLGLGLGLGFGFILAIALVVTLYIYHKKCGSKKENEDENRKKPEDHTQRVGNKTDVLKGDQSALKQKVLHSPLPLPPVDNSQPPKASDDKLSRKKLDPIAVENEEANSSEKKKKKKKRKKKKIDNETADNNVEEAGDNGNLN